MDGSALEHSDSDSGESWTLLENTPSYGEEAPELAENSPKPGEAADNTDKDEDTDGISIISDSEPESSTPCDLSYDKCTLEDGPPTEPSTKYVSAKPLPYNSNDDDHESMRTGGDFLGDSKCKLKTYVHRRNKRLSTVLNIIVLGSVITAAGVAIGHMWGARNDCSLHTAPSVNKILSNLYKLQEENAYLRNKLKELTLINNYQMHQRKLDIEKGPFKQHKCKKVFEESLNNRNANTITKCVDNESIDKTLENHLVGQEYEKDFLSDIDKLRNVYEQNKSWLDLEIDKRMKHENESVKKIKVNLKSPKSIKINEERKLPKKESLIKAEEINIDAAPATETVINITELVLPAPTPPDEAIERDAAPDKKVSYADSLKSESKINKKESNKQVEPNKVTIEHNRKKRHVKEYDAVSENSVSEDELMKDDRYNSHKYKPDRKKHDRHKIHKKQKRKNKYEQWEMKGGYMKDYDDFSITSSQENEYILKNPDRNVLSRDFERNNYINQYSENEDSGKSESQESVKSKLKSVNRTKRDKSNKKKEKDMSWYEKRTALRTEARMKLEQELVGESSPNNAGWYFRRMQRREQCRVKGDNATYRKLSKRVMNFKTKH